MTDTQKKTKTSRNKYCPDKCGCDCLVDFHVALVLWVCAIQPIKYGHCLLTSACRHGDVIFHDDGVAEVRDHDFTSGVHGHRRVAPRRRSNPSINWQFSGLRFSTGFHIPGHSGRECPAGVQGLARPRAPRVRRRSLEAELQWPLESRRPTV